MTWLQQQQQKQGQQLRQQRKRIQIQVVFILLVSAAVMASFLPLVAWEMLHLHVSVDDANSPIKQQLPPPTIKYRQQDTAAIGRSSKRDFLGRYRTATSNNRWRRDVAGGRRRDTRPDNDAARYMRNRRRRANAANDLITITKDVNNISSTNVNTTATLASSDATVVFLHIGKSGGTAFDKLMKGLLRDLGRLYVGHQHFDWSYIAMKYPYADVVTILRPPVSRAVSHFYFARGLPWTRGKAVRDMTLSEYLNSRKVMMETRGLWQDGQAAVRWLTGTKIANSVAYDSRISVAQREELALNITHMCLLAAHRLNQTKWFGLLNRLDESMEMLAAYLHLPPAAMNLTLPKANRKSYPQPTSDDKAKLASLMPMDLWLWEYAERLFDARWEQHKDKPFVEPLVPPLPNITCFSTRDEIECANGPLSATFPKLLSSDSVYNRMKY